MNPYEGYPQSLLAWGWTLLAICVSIVPVTIWKRQKSELPAMEEDPIFRDIFSAEVNAEDDEESPSERSK